MRTVHTTASREDVQTRLCHDRNHLLSIASPSRDIFQKTSALIAALRRTGCPAPACEETNLSSPERNYYKAQQDHEEKLSRGYRPVQTRCGGRISMNFTKSGKPFIMYV